MTNHRDFAKLSNYKSHLWYQVAASIINLRVLACEYCIRNPLITNNKNICGNGTYPGNDPTIMNKGLFYW